MLCDVCRRSIQLELELAQTQRSEDTYNYHVSKESLRLSALQGCMVCVALEKSLQQYSKTSNISPTRVSGQPSSDCIFQLRVTGRGMYYYEDPVLRSYVVKAKVFERISRLAKANEEASCLATADFFLVHSSSYDHIHTVIGPQPHQSKRDKAWQLVATWLGQCRSLHVECNAHRSTLWCPSRLLDLTLLEEGWIRLVSRTCDSIHRQYMTLSHRWGFRPSLRLTKDNEAWMKSGFSISHLPQTFRDAAELVWKLGASYLWIDSLCIKQDSTEDWQRESNEMGDIYKFSLCNIGATGTANENDGLHWGEGPSEKQVDHVELDIDGETALYHVIRSNFWSQLGNETLNKRAWVLQERYLAPSMVHFASEQLFWECHEFNASQSFPLGIPEPLLNYTFRGEEICPEDEAVGQFDRYDENYDETDKRLKTLSVWLSLCNSYTGCGLTRPEDKLVALSGLANEFEKSIEANYMAGLWDFHLVPQLLWELLVPEEPVAKYRGPSWSWASKDGILNTSNSNHLGNHLIDVIEAKIENSGYHRNGAVESGFLKVRGSPVRVKLYPVTEDWSSFTAKLPFKRAIVTRDLAGNNMWLRVTIDNIITPAFFEKEYICLPLQYWFYEETEYTGRPCIAGLLLEKEGNAEGCFRRIGVFGEAEERGVTSAFRTDLMSKQILYII